MGGSMENWKYEEILGEMKAQTALLIDIAREIKGLRADTQKGNLEAMEKGMKDMMSQVTASLEGTPIAGIFKNMMSKMGGPHG
jgi:hypothetical protein